MLGIHLLEVFIEDLRGSLLRVDPSSNLNFRLLFMFKVL